MKTLSLDITDISSENTRGERRGRGWGSKLGETVTVQIIKKKHESTTPPSFTYIYFPGGGGKGRGGGGRWEFGVGGFTDIVYV